MNSFEKLETLLEDIKGNNIYEKIEKAIEMFPSMDGKSRHILRETLRNSGLVDIADVLDPNIEPPKVYETFICPEMGMPIRTTCRLSSCRYNIGGNKYMGCLLRASGSDKMTPQSMFVALGIRTPDTSAIFDTAMEKMRMATINVAIDNMDIEPHFVFLKNNHICCVCEKVLTDDPVLSHNGIVYCSHTCIDLKSPSVMDIEIRFGIDAKTIANWAIDKFNNIDRASQALGCTPPVLVGILQQDNQR